MAEEKEEGFKITDRRKFNADGTPREAVEEPKPPAPEIAAPPAFEQGPAEPLPEQAQAQDQTSAAAGADNVVSFPGEAGKKEAGKKKDTTEAHTATPAHDPAPASGKSTNEAAATAEQAYNQASNAKPSSLPQASFVSLVNMLGIEAAMHLGLIENPSGGGTHLDLEAARHMIDLLGVVEQKTRGNLSSEEDNLLENMLADLRMQYVMRSKRQ
jgi:hypothetical protein